MQTNKKIMFFLMPAILLFPLSGCLPSQEAGQAAALPDLSQPDRSDSVAKRFEESASQGPTTIQSAIELSGKYTKLSEETAKLRQQNQDLTTQNRRLREQVVALDAQLQQAQKELAQANDLLVEMIVELNNWKSNVIGFREEMRGAEKAQLDALLKILKALGGEVKTESLSGEGSAPTQKNASGSLETAAHPSY
jgi:chromosome segregation ATPase